MYGAIKLNLQKELKEIKEAGLYKKERIITSSQDAIIKVSTGEEVINFCANNYLGLSNNKDVVNAAKDYTRFSWIWNVFSKIYLWNSRYSQTIRK